MFGISIAGGYPLSIPIIVRKDGSLDFDRNWAEYKAGFSGGSGELWIGLDQLYYRTSMGRYGLRVELEDWDVLTYWAEYSDFSVGPESDYYRLNVSGYKAGSTAKDCLTNPSYHLHRDKQFSTYDLYDESTCAPNFFGGWWYSSCLCSHATGRYLSTPGTNDCNGIAWYAQTVGCYSYKHMQWTLVPNY